MTKKRPLLLYLLVIVFVLGALLSIAGLTGTFNNWNWLNNYLPLSASFYWILRGVFLTLACICAALFLWMRTSWSTTYCKITGVLCAIFFWVERLALTQNPLPVARHILPTAITVILLAALFFALEVLSGDIHLNNVLSDYSTKGDKNDQTTC